ncbi:unnamed protein product [Phytomonas sp. EM1]|nr:unnamed protein product [Phytomonas sp. EM1]|eukprot:CCW64232.1 unnamed protein product [Phytomonas sp. isolate EM1]
MVGKTYLRYVVGPQGGALASNASLTMDSAVIRPDYALFTRGGNGRRGGKEQQHLPAAALSVLFVPSLEAVRVFSVRSGALMHTLIPAEAKLPLEVTCLQVVSLDAGDGAPGPHGGLAIVKPQKSIEQHGWLLTVGYSNGYVAVFSCGPMNNYGAPVCRFYALGHKVDTRVLALAVDAGRMTLCSAGQDTDITVWDLVSHEADFSLSGHRGGVVSLFLPPRASELLVSASADGLMKVWNVALRQCVQTIVASDAQITTMVADCEGLRLYCGLRESVIKVYKLNYGNGDENSLTAVSRATAAASISGKDTESSFIVDNGSIARRYYKPITALKFSPDSNYMLACTSKTVEVFRMLSAEGVRKKVTRKKKRQREALGRRQGRQIDESHEDITREGDPLKDSNGLNMEPLKRRTHKRVRETKDSDKSEGDAPESASDEENGERHYATASEEVALLRTFFLTEHKVRAACFVPMPQALHDANDDDASDMLHIAVLFNNNSIKTYTTRLMLNDAEGSATWSLEDLKVRYTLGQQVHQSEIRALSFVDNDSALLSLSKEKLLLWRLSVKGDLLEREHLDDHDFYDSKEANLSRITFKGSLKCYNSSVDWEETGDAAAEAVSMAAISSSLCCVGLNNGTVCLADATASEITFVEPLFHVGGVRTVVERPDKSGFLTLGSDRRVVLWTLGLVAAGLENNGDNRASKPSSSTNLKRVTLLLSTEIELAELPLFAKLSSDEKFLGVGLKNHNIQLFFADTLKPYLLLFGHKLPPTSLSFSTDGTLVASVGMDKSLRFWGTDFGDCHRAIHAHDDYITQVEFVKDTHYVFTVSMDGSVKQWDGDNWTMIQLFRQHQRGLWAIAITRNGTCVVTAGVDKCIRCLLRTQDIVFPAEEEERMAQEAMDDEVAQRATLQKLAQQQHDGLEATLAGQQTAATAEAAERLMEALDLVSVELQRQQNKEDITTTRHPLLASCTEWAYLWSVIESIRPSELRHVLSCLTSIHVHALLDYLDGMVENKAVQSYEIVAKMLLALVMPAPGEASSSIGLRMAAIHGDISEVHGARRLEKLRRVISYGLDQTVSRIDYNIAALQIIRRHMVEADKLKFFDLSKIQGYKKKYHSRMLPLANGNE